LTVFVPEAAGQGAGSIRKGFAPQTEARTGGIMKSVKSVHRVFLAAAVCLLFLSAVKTEAQTVPSLKGMSINGATGLYTIPTARIGWEKTADLGIDFGASYNFVSLNPMLKTAVSLFKWVEVSGAMDLQPKTGDKREMDGMLGAKVQFPTTKTALALGGNLQFINKLGDFSAAGQLYGAATYTGEFFSWPAETTIVLGYTFMKGNRDNIDFGMGFDMTLLPDVFQNFVHWILDFSNFSYSVDPFGADATTRGCLNTGLRIDLAALPALSKFKFNIDLAFLDILDRNAGSGGKSGRSVALAVVFGLPVM
jgi:hypothetical protein